MRASDLAGLSRSDYWGFVSGALLEPNYNDLELLRGGRVREIVSELVELHGRTEPRVQEAIAFLVQDLSLESEPTLRPIVEQGLQSSDVHTRATTLCQITGDFDLFDRMLTQSTLDPAKVDAEVAAYRARTR